MARAAKQKRAPARANATERAEVDLKKVEVTAARKLHRYGAVYSSVTLGILVTAAAFFLRPGITLPAGAIAFFATYLVATLSRLHRLNPVYLRGHADESDIPGYVILLVVIATIIASSVSFFVVVNSGAHVDRVQLVLGVLALLFGWLAMHAMLAFHYAYEYYGTDETSEPDASGHRSHVGGLDFPHIVERHEELEEVLENAFAVVLEGTAHLPMLESPERFDPLLLEFLEALSGGGEDAGDD